jgi:hypothetical protein
VRVRYERAPPLPTRSLRSLLEEGDSALPYQLKSTVRAIVDAEIDDIGELPDAGRAFNRQVATYDERLAAVEQQVAALSGVAAGKTTKAQKLAAIGTFAQNKRGGPLATVAVTPAEVRGCTGVSRRYAYELIEAMDGAVDGVRVREATAVQTGSGVEQKGKALLVDCVRVQRETAGVNQFTTGGDENEGN